MDRRCAAALGLFGFLPPVQDLLNEFEEKEAMTAGAEMMASVKERLGGTAFDEISALKVLSEQQGNESTLILELPDRLRTELTTPMGRLTVVDDGQSMQMQTPQGTRTAPPPVQNRIYGQLWRSLPYLLTNLDHESLSFQAEGEETVDGTTYRVVRVEPPAGDSYSLYLETESLRPSHLTLETTNPRSGGTVRVEQVFSDYREVSGVTIPFHTETTQSTEQGEQTTTSTIETLEVNPELEEGTFTLEEAASGS